MRFANILWLVLAVGCQATGATDKNDESAPNDDGMVWTSRAYPTGHRATSALLVERGMPAEVQRGQSYEYEIRLTNLTDMALTNVVLTDTAPDGFAVPVGGLEAEAAGGIATWHLGELEAGATRTVRASAMADKPGSVRHVALVTYDAPLAGATTIVEPRLELQRSAPELVVLADGIEVTYVVRNAGTGTAREVVVEEKLPAGFTAEDGDDTVRIEVGSLGPGESRTVTCKVTPEGPSVFESSAQVTGFGGLAAATEKSAVRVTTPLLRGVVAGPQRAAIGQVYTLTVTLGNDGDGPAGNTRAQIRLPDGASFVDSDAAADAVAVDGSVLTWTAGDLQPGSESKLAVRLRADTAAALEFKATANAHGVDEVEMNAAVEQYGIATVDIDVSDEVDPLQAGSQAVYLVTVRNQGTAAATNIKLVCKLEDGMAYVESTGSSKGGAAEGQVVFEAVPELAAKHELTWRVVVTGEKAGDHRFTVAVTADQLDRPVEASESTRFFE